jgi:hypothetical protein
VIWRATHFAVIGSERALHAVPHPIRAFVFNDLQGGTDRVVRTSPDHVTVEALGLSVATAETLGTEYPPKGHDKGYVAMPIRLPTGESGYIGVTVAKLPKEFHLSNVVLRQHPQRKCWGFLFLTSGAIHS